MTLKQLENPVKIDEDMTNPENGTYYNKRTIEQLLEYGLILIDKPPGPTSHEVVAWAKRILEIPKAGHSDVSFAQILQKFFSFQGLDKTEYEQRLYFFH